MAIITTTISAKEDKVLKKSQLMFRFVGGRGCVYRLKSGLHITPSRWNIEDEEPIIPRLDTKERRELIQLKTKLDNLKNALLEKFNSADIDAVNKEWFEQVIDEFHFPEKYAKVKTKGFFDVYDDFLEKRKVSVSRYRHFKSIKRSLLRFELYIQIDEGDSYKLELDTFSPDTLRSFEKFLREEHLLCRKDRYKHIYEIVSETRTPQQRGQNTINGVYAKLRTFIIWAIETESINNNPFRQFKVEECVYGTPFYITIDERNTLYKTDFSLNPQLERQRDIFIFQCVIGCRVGDLHKFTRDNIINGAIEYVPKKTKDGRPLTVRVPLNSIAQEILEKYRNCEGEKLFPFISSQKYNVAIKRMFLEAKLTRSVTVINPTTGESEIRPLNEVASSHLARRTFVGNLYKKVKDPNLVGALSGHKEGSRAFARYREIDEQIKQDLVKMLE